MHRDASPPPPAQDPRDDAAERYRQRMTETRIALEKAIRAVEFAQAKGGH